MVYNITEIIYNKGITGIDIIDHIVNNFPDDKFKYQLLLVIQKIKKEFRSEKLIIFFILNFIVFRSVIDLENILNYNFK